MIKNLDLLNKIGLTDQYDPNYKSTSQNINELAHLEFSRHQEKTPNTHFNVLRK